MSSSLFSAQKKKISTYRHRRQNKSVGQVASFIGSFLSDNIYYIGCTIERSNRNGARKLRVGLGRFFTALGRGLKAVSLAVLRFIKGIFVDLLSPFYLPAVQHAESIRLSKTDADSTSERLPEAKKEIRAQHRAEYKRALSRFFNLTAPLTALAAMIIVFASMLSLDYGLQVNIGNRIIGYVQNESEFNNAKRIIDGRIVSVGSSAYWMSDATYYLSVVDKTDLTSTETLADRLLLASGEDITEAKGLYVGGVFIGATTSGEMLVGLINSVLKEQEDRAALIKDAVVRFVREIEFVDGIYLTSTVRDFTYFEDLVSAERNPVLTYTVQAGDRAEDIAAKNSMTLASLSSLNPDVRIGSLNEGETLILSAGENLFAVRTVVRITRNEPIDYEFISISDNRYNVGYFNLQQKGVPGLMEIVEEKEYKNGRVISTTVINKTVVRAPQNHIVVIGVKIPTGTASNKGTGKLIWPVGGYWWSVSRGYIPGSHYGIDIAAAMGRQVFAADNGVVRIKGTYSDYGNFILISHNNGMMTAYAHLSEFMSNISVGTVVAKGQVIGLVGSTGRSTGPHLHFEVRLDNIRQDPMPWLTGEIYNTD